MLVYVSFFRLEKKEQISSGKFIRFEWWNINVNTTVNRFNIPLFEQFFFSSHWNASQIFNAKIWCTLSSGKKSNTKESAGVSNSTGWIMCVLQRARFWLRTLQLTKTFSGQWMKCIVIAHENQSIHSIDLLIYCDQ